MAPIPGTDVSRTLEAIIKDKFRAVGLERYLHIFHDVPGELEAFP
jgi:hypothetical protein